MQGLYLKSTLWYICRVKVHHLNCHMLWTCLPKSLWMPLLCRIIQASFFFYYQQVLWKAVHSFYIACAKWMKSSSLQHIFLVRNITETDAVRMYIYCYINRPSFFIPSTTASCKILLRNQCWSMLIMASTDQWKAVF